MPSRSTSARAAAATTAPRRRSTCCWPSKAAAGKVVARLKGGDPYLFGRGGEEARLPARQGIPFEVVPGVTAGFAAAAYAGIPLTHRDFTTSLGLVTGHEDPAKKFSSLDWEKLATGVGTLVFYMGMANLELIAERADRPRPQPADAGGGGALGDHCRGRRP